MKLKRLPEDFQVEELPSVSGGESGPFTLYRLTKRGLGTPEAIEAIRRRWRIAPSRIAYGGLKDRHARTVQYLTILDGPNRPLRQTNLELVPVGRLDHPYGAEHFRGNRFAVVLRDLSSEAAGAAERAAAEAADDGVPNYFDDQRFGSVGESGEFIIEAWLRDDPERALFLALAEPSASDRPETRRDKDVLREFWGRWRLAALHLGRSPLRVSIDHLTEHPDDFRGAFGKIRRETRLLYVNAFQSHLWNLMLGRLIERQTRPEQRTGVAFKTATLPFYRGLDPEQALTLRTWEIPLPSARTMLDEGPVRELADEVLTPIGLRWEDLKIKHLKDVFLSKGERRALAFPEGLRWRTEPDELYDGRVKLSLAFDLPKGSYATILVKRLTEAV